MPSGHNRLFLDFCADIIILLHPFSFGWTRSNDIRDKFDICFFYLSFSELGAWFCFTY